MIIVSCALVNLDPQFWLTTNSKIVIAINIEINFFFIIKQIIKSIENTKNQLILGR
jgi:hypothetical protein